MPPADVRLTFPAYDIGGVNIMAGGKCVGFCLAEFWNWRAYLFPAATGRRDRPLDCEEVTGKTLRELREKLRERVEVDGPWWTG